MPRGSRPRRPSPAIAQLGIGYVPVERRIVSNMTTEKNLRVSRRFVNGRHPWCLRDVYEAFPKLAELRRRRAGLLSGGEQQMPCSARSLSRRQGSRRHRLSVEL
jgi:branched-chain amino acid transport system ATP-binding protein